jgi:hypothetical protein
MRKMPSRCIGVPAAGSSLPTGSNHATLPCLATSSTAPGILPLATSALSTSVSICSRSVESPTRSGVAVGSDCAAASSGAARLRPSTAVRRVRWKNFMVLSPSCR